MYPVMLNLEGRRCVVVGGGRAALMKAARQRECGADVTVISPEFIERFEDFDTKTKKYESSDIKGAFLVTAATGDKVLNRKIAADARERGILIYAVDDPANSDIILPAAAREGDITVTVSTNGGYPYLAKKLRDKFAKEIIPYAALLPKLTAFRSEILKKASSDKHRILKKELEKSCRNIE